MTDNAPDKSSAEANPVEKMADGVADASNPEITIDAPAPAPSQPNATRARPNRPGPLLQRKPAPISSRPARLRRAPSARRARKNSLATSPIPAWRRHSTSHRRKASSDRPPTEAPAKPGPSNSPAPKTHKLKVRHQEKEVSENELLALAQKALAADDYLGDARKLYEEARRHDQARRSQGAPHQEQREQNTDLPTDPSQTPHQEDPLAKALERVQYGEDPKEVAKDVRQALRSDQAGTTQQAILNQRMADDLSQTLRVFAKFKKENEALLAEPHAEAVMQDILHKAWRDDLRSVGVPEDRIPLNPNDLQQWHRRYRVLGHTVRSAEQTFTTW